MDIIYLNDLRIDTIIGIYDWERAIKQTLSFDLEMATDIARSAAMNASGRMATRAQSRPSSGRQASIASRASGIWSRW